MRAASDAGINLRRVGAGSIGFSFDETTTPATAVALVEALGAGALPELLEWTEPVVPMQLRRDGELLPQAAFNSYHSEHEMLRYLRRLADRDLALDRTMIPLGSCTMKLNATSEMEPITWPEFADIHPYAPDDQTVGYRTMIAQLEAALAEITGYDAVSVQPNAGSQGEFAGLLAIRAYHRSRGDDQRTICLIPASAHGTNAASAVMAGLDVAVVRCDDDGNVDLADLRVQVDAAGDRLAAIMVTYPSTHGVFEPGIRDLCSLIHDAGGQVYVDGANLNALVGLAQPGRFGADVSHLNLHKTFCIPHGGGGPGVGPIGVRQHLAPFLPGDPLGSGDQPVGPVSAAKFGSAGILPIPWVYLRLMGASGLRRATEVAIVAANYIACRLGDAFPVLYTGSNGRVAHECIIDVREITKSTGVTVDDVAKRLIDYGFHAPTMSFPVAGTLMIEPTESEELRELDRFCDAMLAIRAEIGDVAAGAIPVESSPLRHAPHTVEDLLDGWDRPYSVVDRGLSVAGAPARQVLPAGVSHRRRSRRSSSRVQLRAARGVRDLAHRTPRRCRCGALTSPRDRDRPGARRVAAMVGGGQRAVDRGDVRDDRRCRWRRSAGGNHHPAWDPTLDGRSDVERCRRLHHGHRRHGGAAAHDRSHAIDGAGRQRRPRRVRDRLRRERSGGGGAPDPR